MARRARPGLPAGVGELRDRIEHWRRTRERRTAMPPELWASAVALAGRHGAYPVARGARISFGGLQRRIAEGAAAGRGMPVGPARGFVELTGAQLGGALPPSGTVLELSDASGMRLALRLAVGVEVDVAGVVGAFRQRRT